MECTVCDEGYFFKEGKCSAFSENKPSQGCAYADPLDETVCLICKSEHYMDKEGGCVDTRPVAPKPDKTSVKIMSVLALIFLALF